MQVPDQQKREKILAIAAELFASRPFHEVRLDEIAAKARIGKGTLYTYFKSKESLYFSVLYQGFADLVDELRRRLADGEQSPLEALRIIVHAFTAYAVHNPHLFELMRRVGPPSQSNPDWARKREELANLIEQTIRRGVAAGVFEDAHPVWTARFIPSMVRSVMLYGGPPDDPAILAQHIYGFLEAGLTRKGRP
ncbi:MAG TPA: TetR/AcrR family transcriptional regulator [Phycisphaeraceae bacterium]